MGDVDGRRTTDDGRRDVDQDAVATKKGCVSRDDKKKDNCIEIEASQVFG
jgi:hypothetical protein